MMNSSQILIVSDDAEFVRAVSARLRAQKFAPAITALTLNICEQANPAGYALIVVGPVRSLTDVSAILSLRLDSSVCAVGDLENLAAVRTRHADWLLLPECAGWIDVLVSTAREVLRRNAAEVRARDAERLTFSQQRFGILARSLMEARPGMVNALTSLLGNADLLLLSDYPIPNECREQVRTIHTMALRLKEIVQRLASVESEMELSDGKSQVETRELREARMADVSKI
jgi:hypothetical protein